MKEKRPIIEYTIPPKLEFLSIVSGNKMHVSFFIKIRKSKDDLCYFYQWIEEVFSQSVPSKQKSDVMPNYMKYFLYIFILVGLTSCNGGTSENDSDVLDSIEVVTESEIYIDGIWGLTNYFDTIVTHRELAKYRMQPPTWFGILLDIRDNQIISYGSICNDSGF